MQDYRSHYADILSRGSVEDAYDRVLAQLDPPITMEDNRRSYEEDQRYCAHLEAANQRLFILAYWDRGVMLAKTYSSSLEDSARALHSWVARRLSLRAMREEHPDFEPLPNAAAFEEGTEVEARWRDYLNEKDWPHMGPFLEVASRNPILRGLFPFSSHYVLCFSRCTGYPYFCDLPQVSALGPDRFRVERADGTPLGEGNSDEALEVLMRHVPPGTRAAIPGTARNVQL